MKPTAYAGQELTNAVLRFTADWCGPCRHFAPIFDETMLDLDVQAFVVDVDSHASLASEMNVLSIPAVVVVKDGRKVDHVNGSLTARRLREMVRGLL